MIKSLTLWQPHATLVARGAKRLETRSWQTSYRGPIAIHAAKNSPRSWAKLAENGLATTPPHPAFIEELELLCGTDALGLPDLAQLPSGVIVAVGLLVDVRPIDIFGDPEGWSITEEERAFGVYGSGRFAWFFEDVRPLRPPYFPIRGHQQLWNITADDYEAALDLSDAPLRYVAPEDRFAATEPGR